MGERAEEGGTERSMGWEREGRGDKERRKKGVRGGGRERFGGGVRERDRQGRREGERGD